MRFISGMTSTRDLLNVLPIALYVVLIIDVYVYARLYTLKQR